MMIIDFTIKAVMIVFVLRPLTHIFIYNIDIVVFVVLLYYHIRDV